MQNRQSPHSRHYGSRLTNSYISFQYLIYQKYLNYRIVKMSVNSIYKTYL